MDARSEQLATKAQGSIVKARQTDGDHREWIKLADQEGFMNILDTDGSYAMEKIVDGEEQLNGDEVVDDGKSVEAELRKLKSMFAEDGELSLGLTDAKLSQYKLDQAAVQWAEKPHQAIVSLHHGLIGATNAAESVMFGDALRFDQAIRQNLKNETDKMDLIALDPKSRFQIIQDHLKNPRETTLIMPPGPFDRLIGKKVTCHSYRGDNEEDVNEKIGVVLSKDQPTGLYNVQMVDKDTVLVKLSPEQMRALGFAPLDGVDSASEAERSAESNEWCTEKIGKDVRIDHIPDQLLSLMQSKGVAESALKYQLGTINACFGNNGSPTFKIQLKENGDGYKALMNDWPQLVFGRDFHLVDDLRRKQVLVMKPAYGLPGTDSYKPPVRAIGTVTNYEDGKYTVKIPEHVVTVNPDEIERDVTQAAGEVNEERPEDVVFKVVSFVDGIEGFNTGHTIQGRVVAHDSTADKYTIMVNGATYPKKFSRSDFLLTHGKIREDAKGLVFSGPHWVGEPVVYKAAASPAPRVTAHKTQPGMVVSAYQGSETQFVVAWTDGLENLEAEKLEVVRDKRLNGMEVSFRNPDTQEETKEGVLIKVKESEEPELSRYYVKDAAGKVFTLLFRDFKVVRFPTDETTAYSRDLPIGNSLTGNVEFLNSRGELSTGVVKTVEPDTNNEAADAYTYTITVSSTNTDTRGVKYDDIVRQTS